MPRLTRGAGRSSTKMPPPNNFSISRGLLPKPLNKSFGISAAGSVCGCRPRTRWPLRPLVRCVRAPGCSNSKCYLSYCKPTHQTCILFGGDCLVCRRSPGFCGLGDTSGVYLREELRGWTVGLLSRICPPPTTRTMRVVDRIKLSLLIIQFGSLFGTHRRLSTWVGLPGWSVRTGQPREIR